MSLRPKFHELANYQGATFNKLARFDQVMFQNDANFRNTNFLEFAKFESTSFRKTADFTRAIFQSIAIFKSSTFDELATFYHCKFQWHVNFREVTFGENVDLRGAANQEDIKRITGTVRFDDVTFSKTVDFTNREFLNTTSFNDTLFHTHAPVFANTRLHEGTTWHGVQWPGTPDDPIAARDMADAYSHLRRRSNAIQDHEAELDFYGRELRAKRAAVGGATGFLISLYEWSCGFGASVGLPLVWLFGLWASGPPFCRALLRLEGAAEIDGLTLYGFSLASVGGFFGMRKEFFAEFMKDLPGTVLALSGAQSLLGAVFVFLLGLSLRNRFRIK
ncbi:MAG: pentapeptide repeat-containing protein [Rhodospirillales bacterium]